MAPSPFSSASFICLLLFLTYTNESTSAYEVSSGNSFVCQGRPLPTLTIDCRSGDIIELSSITVCTDTLDSNLESAESCKLTPGTTCDRKIQSSTDQSLAQELNHLFDWIYFKCHGREKCDPVNSTMPEWWYYIDSKSECATNGIAGQQYFAAMLIDHSCRRGDFVPTASAPPSTPLREKPTTPSTYITPFSIQQFTEELHDGIDTTSIFQQNGDDNHNNDNNTDSIEPGNKGCRSSGLSQVSAVMLVFSLISI